MKETKYVIERPQEVSIALGSLIDAWHNKDMAAIINKANTPYRHWQELKHKAWLPEDKIRFWSILRSQRTVSSRKTLICDQHNNFFRMNTKPYEEFLHIIDKEMAGTFMGVADFTENDKKSFISRNIIEEAITSSQLEGANTSRSVAEKLLLQGLKPRDKSEQMIVNSHRTMQRIETDLCKEELTVGLLFELHRMITDKTLPESQQGVLRETLDEKGNKLVIKPFDNELIAYEAPPKEFVEKELPRLIEFANDKEDEEFIHPLIKAIMLHFWIGLLHPFEDGNGRLARILFYWYLLKNDYWAFAYMSLSEKILKSPAQYAMAYIYSEQDDNDLNYFIDYNITKLQLARQDFQAYIKRKVTENRYISVLIHDDHGLNERQLKLLQYMAKDMQHYTTLQQHQTFYAIGKVTAAADLRVLIEKQLLIKHKRGRNIFYYATDKVQEVFKKK
jgi:Fic family protein